MKRMRARSKLLIASVFIVGLILWLTSSLRPKPAGKDWLSVSQPVFGSRTNAKGVFPTVSFVISNTGPRELEFWVSWMECRARADFTLLATNDGPFSYFRLPPFGYVHLPRGAATNLTRDLARNALSAEEPLFCSQTEWFESEPMFWRLGRKLEPRLTQTMEIFDPQWVPPWNSASKPKPPRARGTVFASNVGVTEYFRLVHGFTRSNWLEDLARYEAAKVQQTTQAQAFAQYSPLSANEYLKLRAKSAFVSYCQSTTNVPEPTKLRTAPGTSSTNR